MNKQELIEKWENKEGAPSCATSASPANINPILNDMYVVGYGIARKEILDDLKQLDEPEKVVVPPIIDKFIRENEDPIYEICAWADHYGSDGRTCEDSELSAVINWYEKNSNEFYRAVINGYEVKEEPLYYVELPDIGYLNNSDGGIKHTEQEIKAIDERYWPFAVKVGNE